MAMMYPTVGAVFPGPKHLGALTLQNVLGTGAFGVVFKATAEHGGVFAVKFLHPGMIAQPQERQTLINEVLAAQQVQHPHVLRVLFSSIESSDRPLYIVSEFADGGRLHDRLEIARAAKTSVPRELITVWSLSLVEAMQAVNARVLHRDLKPDNILFDGDVLKVADFGLAKLVGTVTRSVTFKGGQHVLYMAPEAWAGERNEIQIDMYATGIVLFQIATLEFPYVLPSLGASFDEYRRMHLIQPPRVARSVRPDLPQRFSEIIGKLLAKRPTDRYATWQEVRTAIQESLTCATDRSPAVVVSLIQHASKLHNDAIATALAAETKEHERREQDEVDEVQKGEVVEKLVALIHAFNVQTEGPKALFKSTDDDVYTITFPYAEPARLSFFKISPPLNLDRQDVRFAARVTDSRGCGFNLLLRRSTGEIYGEWIACRIRVNPLSARVRSRCHYFGFDAGEVKEIERGYRAMHVYVPEMSGDVDGALSAFVKGLYERMPR
jgi:eukaryotic-like serine/threonine-protein kinase